MPIKKMKSTLHHSSKGPNRYQRADMEKILNRCGIGLSSLQLDQLWTYHNLLRDYNLQLNLTRIHNFNNMVLKLYVDSILPGQLIDLPSPLLDLGTGPGMPGIPLKIAYPHLEIILAESRKKRVDFLEMVIHQLKLKDISVFSKSITPAFENPVNGVITRAVEDISATLQRIEGCLSPDGLGVFMKGPDCDSEIADATRKFKSQFNLSQNIDYTIPNTSHQRRLAVFKRMDDPPRIRKSKAMSMYALSIIESEKNDFFKDLKKLLTGRGIKKHQKALISGTKQVAEVLQNFPERCEAWISTSKQSPPPLSAPKHLKWYQLENSLFKTIDVIGTDAPILLVTIPPMKTWEPTDPFPKGCNLMIPFQDPENVGTVIRSAVAFGVENIILLSESAHPYHPKAIRASGGAVLYANLFEGPSLKNIPDNQPILALSPEGKNITDFTFPDAFGILPGIEGSGLPDHLRKKSLSIPIQKVESLNAATATAVALFIWSQSRK